MDWQKMEDNQSGLLEAVQAQSVQVKLPSLWNVKNSKT